MQKIINIANKEIACSCNALTPLLYTEIFGKDFLRSVMSLNKYKNAKVTEDNAEENVEVIQKTMMFSEMTFVMNKQAEIKNAADLVKLTKVDYYNWLSDFPQGAFGVDVMTEVLSLWQGQTTQHVESKNA